MPDLFGEPERPRKPPAAPPRCRKKAVAQDPSLFPQASPDASLQWQCVFCGDSFLHLERLVVHLLGQHWNEELCVHPRRERAVFHVYWTHLDRWIRCLCGERFTCNRRLDVAPAFEGWDAWKAEKNCFVAHLRREGGLAAHLERLRAEALLDFVHKGE